MFYVSRGVLSVAVLTQRTTRLSSRTSLWNRNHHPTSSLPCTWLVFQSQDRCGHRKWPLRGSWKTPWPAGVVLSSTQAGYWRPSARARISKGRKTAMIWIRTSYAKILVSIIPRVESECWPTSHPKNTGTPALIILTTVFFKSSISVFTSTDLNSGESNNNQIRTYKDGTSSPDVTQLIHSVQLLIIISGIVDEGETFWRRIFPGSDRLHMPTISEWTLVNSQVPTL